MLDPLVGVIRFKVVTSNTLDPVFTRDPLKYRAPAFDSRKLDPAALSPLVVSPNTTVVG
jgi:hypothetical protein